jgi:multiple sugar transport system ATP-binding protein
LGPSGCGKTTTLRLIAGLETPSEGEIYFDGKPVTDVPPHQRNVAMVFQDYGLYPHMNAYDNIAFNLRIKKRPETEIKELVEKTAELLKIEYLLERMPAELSGGEKQRVALARALVRQPAVFLLDEPLSNIDAKLREEMRSELIKIHEQVQTTFIYVTHDQLEAMTLSDKIAVMNQGRIVQYDTPINIYNNPVDLFVAGFVGSPPMNFFNGKIIKDSSIQRFIFQGEDFSYTLPPTLNIPSSISGQNIVLGVRPEDFIVTKYDKDIDIKTSVYTKEFRGGETIISLKFKEKLAKARIEPESRVEEGEVVSVKIKRAYIFDNKNKLVTHYFTNE